MFFPYSYWSNKNTNYNQSSQSTTLNDGLLAYWTFNNAGDIGNDSLNSFDLSTVGTVNSVAGKISNGITPNDDSSYLEVSDPSNVFNLNTNKTIACWVKLTDNGISTPIMGKNGDALLSHWYISYTTLFPPNQFVFSVLKDTAPDEVPTFTSATILSSTWYFLVCFFDLDNEQIYMSLNNVNESPVSFAGETLQNPSTSITLRIPFQNALYINSNVSVDGVGIWNRLLTPTEISTLYNNGNGIEYPFS